MNIKVENRGDHWAAHAPITGVTTYGKTELEATRKLALGLDMLANRLKERQIKEDKA